MIAPSFTCDICRKVRGETNHWFLLIPHDEFVFALASWDDYAAQDADVQHLCGAGCAATALSRALGAGEKKEEESNG